ncbi:MAG TPA: hypothetical protein VI968_03175 [archaeon]|nr:hypothetical protein [archaeon]
MQYSDLSPNEQSNLETGVRLYFGKSKVNYKRELLVPDRSMAQHVSYFMDSINAEDRTWGATPLLGGNVDPNLIEDLLPEILDKLVASGHLEKEGDKYRLLKLEAVDAMARSHMNL